MPRTSKTRAVPTVKVAGKVFDDTGNFYPKGAKLEGLSKETLESLRAKGFID